MLLWSNIGKHLNTWSPHESITRAVAIRGDFILSVGDVVCVYSRSRSLWQRSAWNNAASIAAEWMTEKQFLVADFNGLITLDHVDEDRLTEVCGYDALLYLINAVLTLNNLLKLRF